MPQVLRRERPRVDHQLGECAGKDDAPALLASPQPEIHEVIGHRNHVRVVLDDQHGVALIAQLAQDRNQPQVVTGMESHRRLVEHV